MNEKDRNQLDDEKKALKKHNEYLKAHSKAEFSHGICPECVKKLYPDYT